MFRFDIEAMITWILFSFIHSFIYFSLLPILVLLVLSLLRLLFAEVGGKERRQGMRRWRRRGRRLAGINSWESFTRE